MFQNRISLILVTFLITGVFYLATAQQAEAGFAPVGPTSCCEWELNDGGSICSDGPAESKCLLLIDAKFIGQFPGETCNRNTGMCVGEITRAVPTMSEWGLIATAGVLGIVGFIAIRRKKVTA